MRILLVDADPRAVMELRRKLAGMGHQADCVDDPWDAVRRLRSGLYDAVIMDFGKPYSRGAWLLRAGNNASDIRVFSTLPENVQEIVDRMERAQSTRKQNFRNSLTDPARLFDNRNPPTLSSTDKKLVGHASVTASAESGRAVVCVKWVELPI